MNIPKKIAWVIAAMIVIGILKFALNRFSPASVIFHDNLLTGVQWLLLLGITCWLLLQLAWKLIAKKDVPWWWVLIFLVLIISGEWGIKGAMKQSRGVSAETHAYLLKYYLAYERELPEVQKECAVYDPELAYLYKPGARCTLEAPEFSEPISINSGGLRDDEASLAAPQVICLGDSYTMGSGAPQQQTYPQVLEKITGLKVLNAGVSSYGTAREMMLLKRLDTSALKYLVIQYCFNDIAENADYAGQYKLHTRSAKEYEQAVNDHRWAMQYYPLKRVLTISRMVLKDKVSALFSTPAAAIEKTVQHDTAYVPAAAKAFIDIVYHAGIDFSKVKVVVVDVNRYPVFDHHLMEVAKQIVQSGNYSDDFKKSLQFVDVSPLNDPRFYFPLDNHLNVPGHARLAKLISEALPLH